MNKKRRNTIEIRGHAPPLDGCQTFSEELNYHTDPNIPGRALGSAQQTPNACVLPFNPGNHDMWCCTMPASTFSGGYKLLYDMILQAKRAVSFYMPKHLSYLHSACPIRGICWYAECACLGRMQAKKNSPAHQWRRLLEFVFVFGWMDAGKRAHAQRTSPPSPPRSPQK